MSDTTEALRAALAAGPTPGPWFEAPGDRWTTSSGAFAQWGEYRISAGGTDSLADGYYRIGAVSNVNDSPINKTNAAYIAAACNAAPSLLAELDALKAERGALRADAERYRKWRAAFTSEHDEPLMLKLANAWDPEDVDAAIDAALKEPTA